MLVAFLFIRPRLAAMGGVAVVTSLMPELIAVVHAARAFVILNWALILPTRRAVDGVERAFSRAPLARSDDLDTLSRSQF